MKNYPKNGPSLSLQQSLIQGKPWAAKVYDAHMAKIRSDYTPVSTKAKKS